MLRRIVFLTTLLAMALAFTGLQAAAAIGVSDVLGFLYEGRSYLPLQSVANVLDAPLSWDSQNGQAVMSYLGKDLALKPNSLTGWLAGQPVELTAPAVVVDGRTYIPLDLVRKHYGVPVEWNGATSEVRLKGNSGWTTVKVRNRAPWHGGPPPWAPAWGKRGHDTPAHQSNSKRNGNGKAKGSKKGR